MSGSTGRNRAIESVRRWLAGVAIVLTCDLALPPLATPPAATERPTLSPAVGRAHPDERPVPRQARGTSPADENDAATEDALDAPAGVAALVSRAQPPRAYRAGGGEFAWRAVHGLVDGRRWRAGAPAKSPVHGRRLHGIGFPAVTTRGGKRVYRPLVAWREAADAPAGRLPIPHLRCMGLSPAAVARRASRYEERILALSRRHDVSAALVKAVITAESCFDPNARSPVGALGLMQLMPRTAKWLQTGDPRKPDANLNGGIRYLSMLLARYDGDRTLALAAYNAGPGNVTRYGGVPPFTETRHYVKLVLAHARRYVAATALAAR